MFFRYNLPAIVWSVIILVLTLSPRVYVPKELSWNLVRGDLFAHAFLFAVLVFLLMIGFTKGQSNNRIQTNAAYLAIAIAAIFGIVIEVLQGFIPERSFEYLDMAANTMGAFLGWGVFTIGKTLMKKNNR